ncbi:MAG: TylF/MycF/NovP-related O-methyltransferase [Paracoccaceae bacterium]
MSKGVFADTLPDALIEQLSILHLERDMYSSTIDAISVLYPKLQPGGFCIVDDHLLPNCVAVIHDYRDEHGIEEELITIDKFGAYWRKTQSRRNVARSLTLVGSQTVSLRCAKVLFAKNPILAFVMPTDDFGYKNAKPPILDCCTMCSF